MRLRGDVLGAAMGTLLIAAQMVHVSAQTKHENVVLDLWSQGKVAFGVYAPNESSAPRVPGSPPPAAIYTKDGGEKLATNVLYDYVFLNLEGAYDVAFVKAITEGLRSPKAVSRKTLIVRIPAIDTAGAAVTKARVKEILDLGADGVTIPHVVGIEQAKQALSFFQDAKADVWSPSNPKGEKIAMLMIEDPGALAQVTDFANLKGISILACGIGSLAQALGGDRVAAEKGTQTVLAETKRTKLVNMLPASPKDVEQRVKEGFLAVLAQGATADETIKIGRAAAGR